MIVTKLKEFQQLAVQKMTDFIAEQIDSGSVAVLLHCPTAGGKTLMMTEAIDTLSNDGSRTVWFWFAPFAALVAQTVRTLTMEGLSLRVRDIRQDRRAATVKGGDIFVMTWATVARSDPAGSLVRSDLGENAPSIDRMVATLRASGFRIGAVVDEAHLHIKNDRSAPSEAFEFYREILRPDIMLLATSTPGSLDTVLVPKFGLPIGNFKHVEVIPADVVAALAGRVARAS